MNNKEWNKTLKFCLETDFNVDKQKHLFLYLMNKNDFLEEYILSLVEKDLEERKSLILDLNTCNKIILTEMGYEIDNKDENYLLELQELFLNLKKGKEKRQIGFLQENSNELCKKYSLSEKEIFVINKEEVFEKERIIKNEKENENERELKVNNVYNNINLSSSETEALDNIAGL